MSHAETRLDHLDDERATGRGVFALREFLHDEAFGGVLLLACALVALAWANSPWDDAYTRLWDAKLTLGTNHVGLTLSLGHWVSDGLMALFFVVVGRFAGHGGEGRYFNGSSGRPYWRISKCSFTRSASLSPISAIFWPAFTLSPSFTRMSWLCA